MKSILVPIMTFTILAHLTAAASAQTCRNFEGTVLLQMTKERCTSPVGICTEGKVESSDPSIAGANWFFTSLGTAKSAGLSPSVLPETMLSYAGSAVVTTVRDGTFSTADAGVYDTKAGAFSQLDRIIGGTGKFTEAKDRLILVTATSGDAGFKTYLRGEVCVTRE